MNDGDKSSGPPGVAPRCSFRAQLFGGSGSGITIELPELTSRISVYRNGGAPFAAADDHGAAVGDAELIGTYELVGPIGPETPIYVPSAF